MHTGTVLWLTRTGISSTESATADSTPRKRSRKWFPMRLPSASPLFLRLTFLVTWLPLLLPILSLAAPAVLTTCARSGALLTRFSALARRLHSSSSRMSLTRLWSSSLQSTSTSAVTSVLRSIGLSVLTARRESRLSVSSPTRSILPSSISRVM